MKFNSVAIGLLFALFASDFYQSRLQLPLGTVEGTVVDSNGVPVAGAWVEAENTGNTGMQISRALSNRQGMFTIRGLHPGAIRLYAYKANDIHGHPFLTSLGWYGMAVSKEAPDGPWLKVKSGEVISMTAKLKRSR
jgi:Carboxypeptidase regulatory-like domain